MFLKKLFVFTFATLLLLASAAAHGGESDSKQGKGIRIQSRRAQQQGDRPVGRQHLLLRRARAAGVRDREADDANSRRRGLQSATGHFGDAHRFHGDLRLGSSGHRDPHRVRHHAGKFSDAGSARAQAARRGRARTRRRPQRQRGGDDRRGLRREKGYGRIQTAGDAQSLRRSRRGTFDSAALLRARRIFQRRRRGVSHPHRRRAAERNTASGSTL